MVLEPWITPSLFYQFLDADENSTAMDIYSFCTVLGPEEGNKQLKRHWKTWVTEDIINDLAASGAVNSLRLPVGDFMYKPYGPYGTCFVLCMIIVYSVLYLGLLAKVILAPRISLTLVTFIHSLYSSSMGFSRLR